MNPKTVIIIGGPTASGKTDIAIDIADAFSTKIISADSRQCFKELNVGVAKPSPSQLKKVEHCFINSHSIHDEVNAAVFEKYALECANKIFLTNDVALMVGGTGMYIKAFCEGLDEMPHIPFEVRDHIKKQYLAYGLSWLQQQVYEKDPDYWEQAEQKNPQRLMRALELITFTGIPLLKLRQGQKKERPFKIIKFSTDLNRTELYNNIDLRVDKMIEDGLVEEAKTIFPFKNLNPLQTVGYKELFSFFDKKISLSEAIDDIKKNTRHYAKRQVTWFKNIGNFNRLPQNNPVEYIREQYNSFINQI